jgi:hypothetical protein
VSGVDIYLGLTQGAVASRDGAVQWCEYAKIEQGADILFARAAQPAASRWGRRGARVWLSGALARPFLCGPVAGLRRWREVMELAQAAAVEATGIEAPCAVSVESWPHPKPAMAVAVGTATLDTVERTAHAHRVPVRSLRPWWAWALGHISARDASIMAMTDSDSMTVLIEQDERLHTANGYLPSPSSEHEDKLLARLALTAGVGLETLVRIDLSREQPFGGPFEKGVA